MTPPSNETQEPTAPRTPPTQEAKAEFVTEDGYKFYLLENGRVTDSKDPGSEDMSWPTFQEFFDGMAASEMGFSTKFRDLL